MEFYKWYYDKRNNDYNFITDFEIVPNSWFGWEITNDIQSPNEGFSHPSEWEGKWSVKRKNPPIWSKIQMIKDVFNIKL